MSRAGAACDSAGAVADVADTVFVSLPTPDVVRAVAGDLAGGGALRAYVDLSTTGPEAAAEVAAARRGRDRVPRRARERWRRRCQAGTLTIMAAGDEALFDVAAPAARGARAQRRARRFEPGQGQLAKVLNNLLSASAIAITGEALALGVPAASRRARCSTSSTRAAGVTRRARTSSPGTCSRGPSARASGSS